MGLFGSAGQFAAQVLVTYKGDTKDLSKKMRGLKGDEKKLAKVRKEAMEEANSGIEGHIGVIGRATIAVGALAATWFGASKAMRLWAKDSQLHAAAAGVSIDGLRKASHGLLTEQQLLTVAAAAMNGQFQGTQKELESVVGGITQLVHEGNDLEQLVQVLGKSLQENGVEELQQFGIQVRDVTGAIAVKGTEAARDTLLGAMEELDAKFVGIKSDEAVKSLNEVEDATRDLGVAFGWAANEVASGILNITDNIRELAFLMQDDDSAYRYVIDLIGAGPSMAAIGKGERARRLAEAQKRTEEADRKYWDEWTKSGSLEEQAEREEFVRQERTRKFYQGGRIYTVKGADKASAEARRKAAAYQKTHDLTGKPEAWFARMMGLLPSMAQAGRAGDLIGPDVLQQFQRGESERFRTQRARGRLEGPSNAAQMMTDLDEQLAGFHREDEVSFLEGIFGPIDEFNDYKAAFETLAGGMNIAFDAWLQGADIGEALLKGLREQAKLLAKELWMQATSHAAWAVGEFAFGKKSKAAAHAKAAAVFGGAAIAVGGAVRGGPGGGGVATAPGAYGGRGQASQNQRPLVMVFAGDYAADRQEAGDRAFEAMESYRRRNGESNIVVNG